ncbi:hypothetical protein DM860_015769 [Cuscuta australis]|uniref:Uncharacterized protein n=1 Tax=Cuscuta australis TaxID=267555 RepID=A0A328DY42_9ASTE|nr:hypothetical protein DM860_015769 [Cuscuta australis]
MTLALYLQLTLLLHYIVVWKNSLLREIIILGQTNKDHVRGLSQNLSGVFVNIDWMINKDNNTKGMEEGVSDHSLLLLIHAQQGVGIILPVEQKYAGNSK